MRLRRIFPPLAAGHLALGAALGAALAGCSDLDLTNPNQPSSDTFWQTGSDAVAGINATYNALQNNGTYGRWLVFVTDLRSDIGRVSSPWTDLSNFTKFTFTSTDFEVNREVWQHHYQAIFRANQVVDRVPGIQGMDATLRARVVGEAKFIRALLYFNLVNLYGGGIPLIVAVPSATDRAAASTAAAVYAQIEKDLTEAAAALPASYTGADVGRATSGAAQAMLGKARLQQRKWAEASQILQQVVASNRYRLIASYADNFTQTNENNPESVFEVQFGDRAFLSQGMRGLNIAKMVGPCGPGFCDGRPTRWYFDQFRTSLQADGQPDPRIDATLYYNRPGMVVYNRSFQDRYGNDPNLRDEVFFKKYGDYYLTSQDQDWDSGINFRVIRYADVLLMLAEALNEQGNTAGAYPLVNQVRARVSLPALAAGLTQAQMRDAILRERMFEFGLEGQRLFDLMRHGQLTATLVSRDPEFGTFAAGRDLLPIPQTELNLNPNISQNPGY
jgi:starch-binding outer membrane protein, SusD/RagB family